MKFMKISNGKEYIPVLTIEEEPVEEFRSINQIGFKGYEVSQFGRVINKSFKESPFFVKVILSRKGDMCVRLYDEHKAAKWFNLSVLVANAFVDNVYGSTKVEFIDGDTMNCVANNLKWKKTKQQL